MTSLLSRLFRVRLVLVNCISGVGGYFLFPDRPDPLSVAPLFGGLFLLVSAASTFNQVMERDLDRLMERTASRPLPRGEITPAAASAVGVLCTLCGTLLLLVAGGAAPALLGVAALLWYLLLYTPLKRRTSLALPVGALCGALPPVIGWCSAGGSGGDFRILLVAALWYLWQVPHFWLLQTRHGAEYRNAAFPLFDTAAGGAHSAICAIWVLALIALILLFPAFGLISAGAALCCVALCCASLASFLFGSRHPLMIPSFNLLPLLFTAALYLER